MGYSPRDHKESDTTERLHFSFIFVEVLLVYNVLGDGKLIQLYIRIYVVVA